VQVTEIYLEEFQSRQARVQHARFSPLSDFKPRKVAVQRHRYKHLPHRLLDDAEE
jgi:hypothetical protein